MKWEHLKELLDEQVCCRGVEAIVCLNIHHLSLEEEYMSLSYRYRAWPRDLLWPIKCVLFPGRNFKDQDMLCYDFSFFCSTSGIVQNKDFSVERNLCQPIMGV